MVHRIFEFYKLFYSIGGKLPKRERYGIYATADRLCISIIEDLIAGALETKALKRAPLVHARLRIEMLKRLIRLMHELKAVPEKWYIATEQELQEISKMLNGWIRYVEH
ncbi:MAG: four helix bundle protein [Candidatus Yanofskybacteria bacterium]|nr:four helix bundle protein [Candidatus Yanofskybacteria bacterium]